MADSTGNILQAFILWTSGNRSDGIQETDYFDELDSRQPEPLRVQES